MKINQFILKRKNYIFGLINSSKLGKPTFYHNNLGNIVKKEKFYEGKKTKTENFVQF